VTDHQPLASSLLLALLAEHGPCRREELVALVGRLPGPWPGGDLREEIEDVVVRGLARDGPDGLMATSSGRVAAAAWLYGPSEPHAPATGRPEEERVLRFALLFAEAVRDAGRG
jgi:hypothetical protein